MDLLRDIFFVLWFFLPAGVANMVPIFTAHLPVLRHWSTPMDFGRTFRGKKIFGEHKTWRGLGSGILAAILVLWLQQWLVSEIGWIRDWTSSVDYSALPTVLLGICFGVGALLGDALGSFFKRQRAVAPGDAWFPFDQTDYIIGGAVATMPLVQLSVSQYFWLLTVWFGMHLLFSYIGWRLGLKEKPI